MQTKRLLGTLVLLFSTIMLGACGDDSGGGGGGGGGSVTVSGTAATGAPFAGVIEAVNANGERFGPVAIGADGSFAIDIDAGGPYILRAYDPDAVDGEVLFAVAFGGGVYNLTELTTLMVTVAFQNVAAAGAPATQQADVLADLGVLADQWDDLAGAVWAELASFLDEAAVNQAIAIVNANLNAQNVGGGTVDWTTYDFLRTAFDADGTGFDFVLDDLQVIVDIVDGDDGAELQVDILDGDGQVLLDFNLSIDISGIVIVGGGGGGINGEIAGTWSLTVSGTVGGVAVPQTTQTGLPAAGVPVSEAAAAEIAQGNIAADVQGQNIQVNFSNLSITYQASVNGQVGDTVTMNVTGSYVVTIDGNTLPATTIDLTYTWERTS